MKHGIRLRSDIPEIQRHHGKATQSQPLTGEKNGPFENLGRVLSDEQWQKHCRAGLVGFNAIVTYLSQLMAHDVTRSAHMDTSFRAVTKTAQQIGSDTPVNLRNEPLLLHTVYGEGLDLDSHLFRPLHETRQRPTARFALTEVYLKTLRKKELAPAFGMGTEQLRRSKVSLKPRLGDSRNSDHPVLMAIATAFMRLHNVFAQQSNARNETDKYMEARIKTILTWHNIIRKDILDKIAPRRIIPSDVTIDKRAKYDIVQGLFRAFHCLPISRYHLRDNNNRALSKMLENRASQPEYSYAAPGETVENALSTWGEKWLIDLDFFTRSSDNTTGFAPTLPENFVLSGIFSRDLESVRDFKVSSPGAYGALFRHTEKLLDDMRRKLPDHGKLPSPSEVPLFLAFLAEAYVDPEKAGTLGPIGASLVRSHVEDGIKVAEKILEETLPFGAVQAWESRVPKDFAELLTVI